MERICAKNTARNLEKQTKSTKCSKYVPTTHTKYSIKQKLRCHRCSSAVVFGAWLYGSSLLRLGIALLAHHHIVGQSDERQGAQGCA